MDVVFDNANNRYLVSNYSDGSIVSIDGENGQHRVLQTRGNCKSLDLAGDTLYVAVDSYLAGFVLSTGEKFLQVEVNTEYGTAGVAADTSGHVYVTAPEGKLFRVTVAGGHCELFADKGLDLHLHNCAFDRSHNRLIAVEHQPDAVIKAVNLVDGSVTELARTGIGDLEGVDVDSQGNVYVASYYNGGSVYRVGLEKGRETVQVAQGLRVPSGLAFNCKDGVIALCLYEANQVVLIDGDVIGDK
jgi:sugar lactone lactonase YvrE